MSSKNRRPSLRRATVECDAPIECFACGRHGMRDVYWDALGDDLLCTACYRAEPRSSMKERYRRIASHTV